MAWQFGCTVGELCGRMSSVEFMWWRAWFRVRHIEQEQRLGKGGGGGNSTGFGDL